MNANSESEIRRIPGEARRNWQVEQSSKAEGIITAIQNIRNQLQIGR